MPYRVEFDIKGDGNWDRDDSDEDAPYPTLEAAENRIDELQRFQRKLVKFFGPLEELGVKPPQFRAVPVEE